MAWAITDTETTNGRGFSRLAAWRDSPIGRSLAALAITFIISTAVVFLIELVARGSFSATLAFFGPHRPAWTTVILFALVVSGLDALLGRKWQGLLVMAPLTLILAWVGQQKAYYLGDPLYPRISSTHGRSSN